MKSGLGVNFRGFKFGFLSFFGFSAILIAIKMNVDRDQDEKFPRSGRRLIAIKLSIDRDLFEVFGDRDQGLGRIAILQKYFAL